MLENQTMSSLLDIADECIEPEELRALLLNNPAPVCYDGFEPSNNLHIAQAILKVINFNKMVAAGFRCKILIADYFAQLNGKLDGDLHRIQEAGRRMIETFQKLGMDPRVEFIFSSDLIRDNSKEYWELVMEIARHNTLKRVIRCSQIMGRAESDDLSAAQILYPCMQAADIFMLKADVVQMGTDQRKVNVLAREFAMQTGRTKPIILSHEMLPGLLKDQDKMSKSDPRSAIFTDDTADVVKQKIQQAYCPPKEVEGNPCLAYVRCLILPWYSIFTVERPDKYGGNKIYNTFQEITKEYESGGLHPTDLKTALTMAIVSIIELAQD